MGLTAAIIGGSVLGAAGGVGASMMQPDAPDMGDAYREGVLADIFTMPGKMAALYGGSLGGKVTYTDPVSGRKVTLDFGKYGDVQRSKEALKAAYELADISAQRQLELQEKYAPKYIEQGLAALEKADPTAAAIREEMGESVLGALRGGLPKDVEQEVVQAERRAQAARGAIFGEAPVAREAMAAGMAGLALRQQNLANAMQYLQGGSPMFSVPGLAGFQTQTAPTPPMQPQPMAPQMINPQAGAMGVNWAAQMYQNALQYNPWQSFFGRIGGMGTGLASTAAGLQMYGNFLGGQYGGAGITQMARSGAFNLIP